MAFGDLRASSGWTVQQVSISNPTSLTGSVAHAANDLICVVVSEQTNLTTTGVTDNLGNVYTAQNAGTDNGNLTGVMYWARSKGGTLTQIDIACTSSNNNVAACSGVFEGPITTKDASPANNNNTDNTSPFTCPATGTLAQAQEIIISWMSMQGSATYSATSPNLKASGIASSTVCNANLGYQAVNSTSTVSPAWTGTAPTSSIQGTASFRRDMAVWDEFAPQPLSVPVRRIALTTAMIAASGFVQPVPLSILGVPGNDDVRIAESQNIVSYARTLLYPSLAEPTALPLEVVLGDIYFASSTINVPYSKTLLYPSIAEPVPLTIEVEANTVEWAQPLSVPTRARVSVATRPSLAEPPVVTVSYERWYAPLSVPTRLRGLETRDQTTGAIGLPDVARDYEWFSPLSEPVRTRALRTAAQSALFYVSAPPFAEGIDEPIPPLAQPTLRPRQVQPDGLSWSWTPTEVVVAFDWYDPLDQPTRAKPRLQTEGLSWLRLPDTDQFLSWHQPLSTPTRLRGLSTADQPCFTIGLPDIARDFEWFTPFNTPTRRERRVQPDALSWMWAADQTNIGWFYPFNTPTRRIRQVQPDGLSWVWTPAEVVVDIGWFYPFEQPRFPRGLGVVQQDPAFLVSSDPFPETVTAVWSQLLSVPVRWRGLSPANQPTGAFVGSDTGRDHEWFMPLSVPTRRTVQRDKLYYTVGLADVARDFEWFTEFSQPTRRTRQVQPDGLSWSYYTPVFDIAADNWLVALAHPTRRKPTIQPDGLAWLRLPDTDQFLSWHTSLSIPTRRVRFAEHPAWSWGFYFPAEPDMTVEKWYAPLSIPTRRLGLPTPEQPSGCMVKADPFPETVTAVWAQPLAQPTRIRGLSTADQPSGSFTQFDPSRNQHWYQPISVPTRWRGLGANLQAAAALSFIPSDVARDIVRFAPIAIPTRARAVSQPDGLSWSGFTPSTEVVTVDKWLTAMSQPTLRGGFGAYLQNGYFYFNYVEPVIPPGTPSDHNRLFIANVGTLMGRA